jgi:hypothetical protein
MRAYLDAGFLLSALIHSTKGSPLANQILRAIEAPFPVNFLHQLQAENFLVSQQTAKERSRQAIGTEGLRLWRNYLAEGIFQLVPADWDSAFRLALTWNSQSGSPPPFLLLLHPALALSEGATHFLSFDSRARDTARAAGLELLPEEL